MRIPRHIFVVLLLASCAASYAADGGRDDVLVVVNDNSLDSVLIGEYYAQQRNIDPANIVHVRAPNSFFIDWDAFKSLRDQIISFMQAHTLDDPTLTPVICSAGDPPYYCPESVDQLRLHTRIRYLIMTRGVPTRMVVDGSPLFAPNAPTSVDNYLKYWLLNYFFGDINLRFPEREVAFEDGRGMRIVQPAQDKELIVGRVDGVNLEAAKALIDRTIAAERNGIYGKLYPSTGFAEWQDYSTGESVFPDWRYPFRYWLALAGESRPECLDYIFNPFSDPEGKTPEHCTVQLNQQLDPPPARSNSRQPVVHDALLYLGHTDGSATAGSFGNFLNWKKDAQCSVTLCEDAIDPGSCRLNSSDVFHEINTQCVGVAEGFIGFNEQSYPMSYLTVWPTAWVGPGGGDSNQLAFPEVREDIGYDDQASLWFRNADQIAAPKCYSDAAFASPPSVDCVDERRINIKQNITLSSRTIDVVNPQRYRIGFWYKADNIDKSTDLRVRFRVRETGGSSAEIDYGTQILALVPTGDTDWTYGEVMFQLNPALHSTLEYNRITTSIETPTVFAGELGVDVFTVQELSDGIELAQNRSFTQGHKQVSTGDHAANFLSRLNGVGFWGSVSHHQSGGFSFFNNAMETLVYFMRGLPLGDAVWFGESQNSGILYGDPLYSPMAIHLNYLNETDTVAGFADLYGSTINGRDPSRVSTGYTVDYCSGDDLLICEDGVEPWYPTGISGAGGQANTLLGTWDTGLLPAPGPYTLRLAVTSQNIMSGKSQTFYDYYRVNVADVNDPPAPDAPPVLTDEDTGTTTQVVPNDPDAGDTHSYTITGNPLHGSASVTPAGLVTYVPAADYNGSDSLTVTVTDAVGAQGSVAIDITVNPVNDEPIAVADTVTTTEDTAIQIPVLGNDDDIDGDTLSVTAAAGAAHGSLAVNPDNTVTYTPNANFNGVDSFTYTASDGNGGVDTAVVSVTVAAANDVPVAVNGVLNVSEDTVASGSLVASDPDGTVLNYRIVANAGMGAVVVTNGTTGAFTYTPNPDATGADSFSFRANDGLADSNTATVTVTITPVNDAPASTGAPIVTSEDTAASTQVIPGDPDVGDSHSYAISSSPAHGSASITATGLVTYTPAPDYSGVDSLVVTVTDVTSATGSVTISITVNPVSDGPDMPVLVPPSADVPLHGYTFDVTGFSNPGGSSQLLASEWEISTGPGFASSAIVFHRVLDGMGSLTLPFGIIEKGQTYWIQTRHQDSQGAWSGWAAPLVFVTSLTDPNDLDGNGVDDRYQVTGTIDTDENGIDDNQEGMCHLKDAEGARVVGFKPQQGVLQCLTSTGKAGLPLAGQPADELQYGLFSLRIDGLPPGATVKFSVYFPEALPAGSKWVIYDEASRVATDFTNNVTFSGRQATVQITDGGSGDADGVANGRIIDPGGPAIPAGGGGNASGGGGGGCTIKPTAGFDPLLTILWLVSLGCLVRRRRGAARTLTLRSRS